MEVVLKVEELKPSPENVRKTHTKEDVMMMADSIRSRGIINPICVAKNGDGRHEVVAGLLRYKGAVEAKIDEIRCLDVTSLTPQERIDISLSENLDRRGMTAMEEYAAFDKLFKAGMTVPNIATRFRMTEREVEQSLAIGSLPKKIHQLYEEDEIGDRTVRALAIADKKDVTRYLKLKPNDRPRDWDIKDWLGGIHGIYMQKYALFDDSAYTGGKITDLFAKEDEVMLTDGEQFWELQNLCIQTDINDFESKGWKTQQVDYFNKYQWDKLAKKDGGMIIYTVDLRSGAVAYYKGYGKKKGTGKAPTPDNKAGKVEKKPEISQAFESYMAETRHNAVCRHIMDGKHGVIAAIILLIKQPDNVSMQHQGSQVKGDAYIESLDASSDSLAVRAEFVDIMKELNMPAHRWDISIPKLTKALLEYKPSVLQEILGIIIARNWTINGPDQDSRAIGKALGLKTVNTWEADDAFWQGIKNKDTLIKIAKQNKIPIDEGATAKVIRTILSEKIPDTWRPDWLKF